MERKSILYVSLSMETAETHRPILNEIFSNEVDVYLYALQDRKSVLANVDFDVVLAAGVHSYAKCREMFPKDKVLCCARELPFPTFLDPVLRLPRGKKVLLVCETKEVARDVVLQLLRCGINHLDYVPYWPGSTQDVRDIDTALSPGMTQHTPPHVKYIIDMQRRPIAMTTILNLIKLLDLDNAYIDHYTAMNRRFVLETYQILAEKEDQSSLFDRCLGGLIGKMSEAVIVTDGGLVAYCSAAAAALLEVAGERLLHRKLPASISVQASKTQESDSCQAKGFLRRGALRIPFTQIDLPRRQDEKEGMRIYFLDFQEEKAAARKQASHRDEGHVASFTFTDIIAESPAARSAKAKAFSMASSSVDATILILGESGAGKEMFAQSIHNASARASEPFVAVNFGAIPESLVESELFGYEQGAFTGASRFGKKGLFELAAGGTLFLDEITNASTLIQAKLLRVLEEKRLMRVGGTRMIAVDVRVITATNGNIKEMVKLGAFREDLYYRLNAFTLHLPALRERPECLDALLRAFMAARGLGHVLSPTVRRRMHAYGWPGNIRELKNTVDYLTLKADKCPVTIEDLPHFLREMAESGAPSATDERDVCRSKTVADWNSLSLCPEGKALLRLFRENTARGLRPGRRKMLAALAAQGIRVSSGHYLHLTSFLAENGLLSIGKTKQGCRITEAGVRFLGQ